MGIDLAGRAWRSEVVSIIIGCNESVVHYDSCGLTASEHFAAFAMPFSRFILWNVITLETLVPSQGNE